MKTQTFAVKSVFVAGLLALSLAATALAQPSPPPFTNSSYGGGGGIGTGTDWGAVYSNNLASVAQWVHGPYTMPDGSAADLQTILDTAASNYAAANPNGWSLTNLANALAWAATNGMPSAITNADGTTANLVSTNEGPLYVQPCNVEAAQTIGTVKLWPGGSLGLNLTGTNRTIYMWDQGPPLTNHTEFTDYTSTTRVGLLASDNGVAVADHSTAVASTLIAGGENILYIGGVSVGAAAKGMSFGGTVQSGNYNSDLSDMTAATTNGMRLSNHSYEHSSGWQQDSSGNWYWWGYSYISTNVDTKYGNYSTYSAAYDQVAYNAANYLGVWAAGNDTGAGPSIQPTNHYEYNLQGILILTNNVHSLDGDPGGYVTISDTGCAKDTLCVGAVWPLTNGYGGSNSVVLASFSSCGPTDDGRIKPDVVACGVNVITASASGTTGYEYESGTSFATPNVAGSINLLSQYYAQLHTNATALLSSTLKALVIDTADQCGTNIGPSYKYGWGLMNTATAASLIANDATNGLKCFIKEVMLSNGTYIQFPIQSSGTNPVKVSIAWTDPAGVGNSLTNLQNPAIKLVNDLDLRVISPNGATNFPYNLNPDLTNRTSAARSAAPTTGDNTRDNVEQVYLPAPTNGTYLVKVTHKGTLQNGVAQWVSIVTTGNTATAPPPFTLNSIKQTGTNQIAVGWASVVGERYQVQSATNLVNAIWQNIGAQVSARLTNVVVLLPYTNAVSKTFYRVTQVP